MGGQSELLQGSNGPSIAIGGIEMVHRDIKLADQFVNDMVNLLLK
jgi:hypothetical protein